MYIGKQCASSDRAVGKHSLDAHCCNLCRDLVHILECSVVFPSDAIIVK